MAVLYSMRNTIKIVLTILLDISILDVLLLDISSYSLIAFFKNPLSLCLLIWIRMIFKIIYDKLFFIKLAMILLLPTVFGAGSLEKVGKASDGKIWHQ